MFSAPESPRSIFLADDNPENLNVLSEILEDEGYGIRASLSGSEMLESIALRKPDLIILDIHMPGMDGYQVCSRLKENPDWQDIPVIFCSALNEAFNIVKAFEVGGVDYITKPFRSQEVLARVRTHLMLREKENELQQRLKQLEALQNHTLNIEKMKSLAVLIAGIAHEVNNPVNYIINSIEGFRRGFDELRTLLDESRHLPETAAAMDALDYPALVAEMNQLLDGIHSGAKKVHEIVKSLRTFARRDKAGIVPVDIRDEVDRAVLLVRGEIPDGCDLGLDIVDLPPVSISPGDLTRVLIAILSNALDAVRLKMATSGGPGRKREQQIRITGRTSVESNGDSGTLKLTVSDTGVGMPPEVLSRAMDPFFSTRETGSGIGLGLPTCYQIMETMGGSMELESLPDRGTTVTLQIPTTIHG